jgi:hypothetical protein
MTEEDVCIIDRNNTVGNENGNGNESDIIDIRTNDEVFEELRRKNEKSNISNGAGNKNDSIICKDIIKNNNRSKKNNYNYNKFSNNKDSGKIYIDNDKQSMDDSFSSDVYKKEFKDNNNSGFISNKADFDNLDKIDIRIKASKL